MLDKLLSLNLSESSQALLNAILIWIGFAILVGFAARILVPGQHARSAWMTFLVGLTGCSIGPLLTTTILRVNPSEYNPISPLGFISSVASAVIALLCFQLTMFFFPPKPKN